MKKKKAIEIFNRQINCYKTDREECVSLASCSHCNHNVTPEELTEAMQMAISALEKQEQTKEAIPHRNYQYLSDYWCECGWHLGKKGAVKFCADCGRRIKWD